MSAPSLTVQQVQTLAALRMAALRQHVGGYSRKAGPDYPPYAAPTQTVHGLVKRGLVRLQGVEGIRYAMLTEAGVALIAPERAVAGPVSP